MSFLVSYDSSSESDSDLNSEVTSCAKVEASDFFGLKVTIAAEEEATSSDFLNTDLLINTFSSVGEINYGPVKEMPQPVENELSSSQPSKFEPILQHNVQSYSKRKLDYENYNYSCETNKKIAVHSPRSAVRESQMSSKPLELVTSECSHTLELMEHPAIQVHLGKNPTSRYPSQVSTTMNLHSGNVTSLNWNVPIYSHLLLSSSTDQSVHISNVFSKKIVWTCSKDCALTTSTWSLCGKKIMFGGYNKMLHVTDVTTGQDLNSFSQSDFITKVKTHPSNDQLILTGCAGSIDCWDLRLPQTHNLVKSYRRNFNQVLDIEFLSAIGDKFVCSTNSVSRESADRSIMCWDFASGALLSNQIYQERWTCPCLKHHPDETNFAAQTNGNYIAVFSAKSPFKINKKRRFEGHKVAGYGVEFDFSRDGRFVFSGSADGNFHIYDYGRGYRLKQIPVCKGTPLVCVDVHPALNSTVALASTDGKVFVCK